AKASRASIPTPENRFQALRSRPNRCGCCPPSILSRHDSPLSRRMKVKTFKYTRLLAVTALCLASGMAHAFDGPELYQGEQALYDAAKKEGMVVSFDTGPTWANWNAQFNAFKARYPGVELVYNDLGSAATVVALDKA